MAKEVYQCTICGMIHNKMEHAEKCEASHLTVQDVKYVYGEEKSKYPEKLQCLMSDGSNVTFYRHSGGIR